MSKDKKTTEDKIKKKVNKRAKKSDNKDAADSQPASLPDIFIDQCHGDNVMGDAVLFSIVCRDQFLFNGSSGKWFKWDEHYWVEDISNSVLASVGGDVADKYTDRAIRLSDDIKKLKKKDAEDISDKAIKAKEAYRDKISGRAFALKGDRAKKVLGWVPAKSQQMVVDGEAFDKKPHLIACNGGVINLETGECLKGDPSDNISLYIKHDWPGLDAVPRKFINHLETVLAAPYNFEGTEEEKAKFLQERIDYYHRFVGAAVHGSQSERAFMIFYGEHGWNGKGIIMETILHVLGDYAAPVAPEVLLKTHGSVDPAKPTPHVLAMKGRRLLFGSETDEGDRFSPAKVKLYTGGEKQVGRNPHDIRDTHFTPTHTIFLLFNEYPYAKADDSAFWERMHVLRFYWSFKDDPVKPYEKKRNSNLEKELKEEASEILAWIVKGYHKYLEVGGLCPPKEVIKERDLYRFREDTLGQFLNDCCKKKPDMTYAESFKDIYESYLEWYRDNISDNPKSKPSKKSLGTKLGKRFDKVSAKGNLPAYIGIELKGPPSYLDDK